MSDWRTNRKTKKHYRIKKPAKKEDTTVGGIGLSDWIGGKYGMTAQELDYRLQGGINMVDRLKGHGEFAQSQKGKPDRRTCNSTGEMCDRCYHRKNCPRECGHLNGKRKWNW